MPSLTNLAHGTAFAIFSPVFASGAIETKAFVAKHPFAIVEAGYRFAVDRSVILAFAINASPIFAISLLLDLEILVTPGFVDTPGLIALLGLDRVSFCPFSKLIH